MQNPGQVGKQRMEQDGTEGDCPLDPSATGPGRSFVSVANVHRFCSVCVLCIVDSLMRAQILLDESTATP